MSVEPKEEEIQTPTPKPPMGASGAPGLLATPPPPATNQTPPGGGIKFGTRIPNRVFIGGIPSSTNEAELAGFFARFGSVRQAKIIIDKSGAPKGYGFITFETDEEASAVLKEVEAEGGSLSFKDRRLNIGEAVRKFPPIVPNHYDSNDSGPRHGVGQHQPMNHAVMSALGSLSSSSSVDLPLLSQMPAPSINDVLAAAAAFGVPPAAAAAASAHPFYNFFYQQAAAAAAASQGFGVDQGYLGANQAGGWQPNSEQYYYGPQTLPPVSQQSMFYQQMMYPMHAAHGVLANTPPPSDMSSWSSGNSCASSTCSTASLGATGDAPDAASGMLPYYTCVSDSNGMYYLPCSTVPSASTSSSVVYAGANSSQPSPLGLTDMRAKEGIIEEETIDVSNEEIKTDLSEGECSIVSKDSGVPETEPSSSSASSSTCGAAAAPPPKPSRSLSAIIRDRRKAQQQARMDSNNNCPKKDSSGAAVGATETPVISVSKILDEGRDCRSPSPLPPVTEEGTPMTPPVGFPSATSALPSFLPQYQYCPPPPLPASTAGAAMTTTTTTASSMGGMSMPPGGSAGPGSLFQFPQLYHPQQQPPPLVYPRPPHHLQGGSSQQQQQRQYQGQQRRVNGWQNDGSRFRGGRHTTSSPAAAGSKAFPRPRKADEPSKEPESRNVVANLENLSVS